MMLEGLALIAAASTLVGALSGLVALANGADREDLLAAVGLAAGGVWLLAGILVALLLFSAGIVGVLS